MQALAPVDSAVLVGQVTPEWINAHLLPHQFEALCRPALEQDRSADWEQTKAQIARGHLQVWVAGVDIGGGDMHLKAAVLCSVEQDDDTGYRTFNVMTAGGEAWGLWGAEMSRQLQEAARENECTLIRAFCRPGMGKWLKDLGWERRAVVMEVNLDG